MRGDCRVQRLVGHWPVINNVANLQRTAVMCFVCELFVKCVLHCAVGVVLYQAKHALSFELCLDILLAYKYLTL